MEQRAARATKALLDGDVGPVLVGLRTLEWRWDQLAGIGVDPDEMLAGLVDRAAGAAKLAHDLCGPDAASTAVELHATVSAIADASSPALGRAAGLRRAVALATDVHHLVEDEWLAASWVSR